LQDCRIEELMRNAMVVLVLVLSACTARPAREDASTADLEGLLRGNTQALPDAIARGDVAVCRTLLQDDMLHIDENGIVRSKDECDPRRPKPDAAALRQDDGAATRALPYSSPRFLQRLLGFGAVNPLPAERSSP
jgi:hypothetical protein